MATRIGLEPTTPSVTGWCSNQLSYRAMIAQVVRRLPPERALLYRKMDGLSSGKNKKAAKKMKKADFLSLLTAFAASSFHEGASLQGHKGPIPEGAGIAQR